MFNLVHLLKCQLGPSVDLAGIIDDQTCENDLRKKLKGLQVPLICLLCRIFSEFVVQFLAKTLSDRVVRPKSWVADHGEEVKLRQMLMVAQLVVPKADCIEQEERMFLCVIELSILADQGLIFEFEDKSL